MPRSGETNTTQGSRRGRSRGRGGRGASTTTTRVHPNGSAEINFQAELAPTDPMPSTSRTRGRHQENPTSQSVPMPTVVEEPAPQQTHPVHPGPIPDSPSNPFFPADTQTSPRHDNTANFHDPSGPPASPSEESLPDPSPGSSTPGTPALRPNSTSRSRARGTPRVGRHSTVNQPRPAATSNARATPAKRKKGARDVWTFFQDTKDGRFCVFCQHHHSVNTDHEVFAFGCDTSTTTLRAHLVNNHLELWVEGCDKFKIPITAETAKGPVANYRASKGETPSQSASPGERPPDIREYSYENFVDAITQFIIADDQSLNVIESPHLRRIFMLLRKDLKDSDIPHRTAIRDHIKVIWDEYLNGLEGELKNALGKISLTMDLWSDPNLVPFMAVTAHWIETKIKQTPDGPQYELKLRAELIGFHRVPGRHDGEHLAQAFLYIMDRISITSKIGWVTLDNASNNDTFMTSLEHELHARGIPFDRFENRIRCFPHIVNLACKAVLTALAKVDYVPDDPIEPPAPDGHEDPISTLRSLIRAIRASSLRRQHFSEIAKTYSLDLQLLRDVDTRWSSTLYMIERALLLEKPLDAISSSHEFGDLHKHQLSELQWEALAVVREILLVPDAFQQKLSAEKTPTLCNALPSFDAMVKIWKEEQECFDYPIWDIIQDGIDKLNAYHDRIELVPAYTISMLLNPSMKLQHIPPEQHNKAKRLLRRTLFPYYEKCTQSLSSQATATAAGPAIQVAPTFRPLRATNYTPHRSRTIRGRSLRNSTAHRTADEILGLARPNAPVNGSLDAEIAQYLNDSSTGTCSLTYWQEHQLHYPTFFMAALDYLAIQGSAVPCERVFSSAKETMTDRRNHIHEDLMEMLQMLKFSFKTGNPLNFMQKTSREDVIAYLESVLEAEVAVPEDINAFIQSLLSTVQ